MPTETGKEDRKVSPIRQPLLGVLAFIGAYPRGVSLALGLLLVNICIEMVLPQIIGSAITNLSWHNEWGAEFTPACSWRWC